MKKREEFDKVLVDITDLFLPEVSQGSWNFTHRNDDIKKIICSWHVSEMEKLLERVEKEVTGEIKIIEPPKEVEKFKEKRQAFMAGEMNILMRLHDKFQSLNKLKEEK